MENKSENYQTVSGITQPGSEVEPKPAAQQKRDHINERGLVKGLQVIEEELELSFGHLRLKPTLDQPALVIAHRFVEVRRILLPPCRPHRGTIVDGGMELSRAHCLQEIRSDIAPA